MKKIMFILMMAVSVSVFANGNKGKLGIGDKVVLADVEMHSIGN